MIHFAQSAEGDEITVYHLQAGIAACHVTARDAETTEWAQILGYYDHLVGLDASPVVALNRAVVVAHVHGPRAGLDAVAAIPDRRRLHGYYLLYAVLGDFEMRLKRYAAAAKHLSQAVQLAELASEKRFLEKKLSACARLI